MAKSIQCYIFTAILVYQRKKRYMKKTTTTLALAGVWLFLLSTMAVFANNETGGFLKAEEIKATATDPVLSDNLTVSVRGTGQTIGDILMLEVRNYSDRRTEYLTIQPALIPGYSRFQAYMVTETKEVAVSPGTTITVPVAGICLDPNKPPLSSGRRGTPYEHWIWVDTLDENWRPTQNEGWVSDPAVEVLNPIREEPLAHRIDFYRDPEGLADFAYTAIITIEEAIDRLHAEDELVTPLSQNREHERRAILQHTVWMTMAPLLGETYSKDDFKQRLVDMLGEKEEKPEDTNMDDEVSNLWDAFELVGREAKVMKKGESSSFLNPPQMLQSETYLKSESLIETAGLQR